MRWKKWLMLIVSLIVLTAAIGCSSKQPQMYEFNDDRFIMDTLVHVRVISEDKLLGEEALETVFDVFENIHSLADRFAHDDTSDVTRINMQAGKKPVQVSDETLSMINRAQYFAGITGGAFDVTVGPLVDIWGFGQEHRVPLEDELEAVLPLVDYQQVEFDIESRAVFLPRAGMQLDLGGVAKGYATDMAVERLREMGIKHAMINAGGNVYAVGAKPDGSPWRVGIIDPRHDGGIIAVLNVKDQAVVSSGDYQRYFVQDGKRYHHIINPATGQPAHEMMQTTVVFDNATDADILSTALFVLGRDKGVEFAIRHGEMDVLFVTTEGEICYTGAMAGYVEFTGEGNYRILKDISL